MSKTCPTCGQKTVFEGPENSHNRVLELRRHGLSVADALHIEAMMYPPNAPRSRHWIWHLLSRWDAKPEHREAFNRLLGAAAKTKRQDD